MPRPGFGFGNPKRLGEMQPKDKERPSLAAKTRNGVAVIVVLNVDDGLEIISAYPQLERAPF